MRNVAVLRALYSPDQERDERGRFGPGGGNAGGVLSGTIPPGLQKWVEQKKAEKSQSQKSETVVKVKGNLPPGLKAYLEKQKAAKDAAAKAEKAPPSKEEQPKPPEPPKEELHPEPPGKREGSEWVNSTADHVADRMGFDRNRIDVVAPVNPRTFVLNGKTLTEAGHFNPVTGVVQINANNTGGVPGGVLAHEIAHAQFDYAKIQRDREIEGVLKQYGHWWDHKENVPNPAWTKSGFLRAEHRDAVLQNNPAIRAFTDAGMPPHFLDLKTDWDNMRKDDGVSNYSKMYWESKSLNLDRAVDETLAEVARIHGGERWGGDKMPHEIAPRYANFRSSVADIYKNRTHEDQVHAQRQYDNRKTRKAMFP